jgi:hypothetical protein
MLIRLAIALLLAAPCLAYRDKADDDSLPGDRGERAVAAQIDAYFAKVWKENRIKPSAPTEDAAFLRRLSIDLTGTIPPPELITPFLKSRSEHKREVMIETLLADRAYAAHWGRAWAARLVGRRMLIDQEALYDPLVAWLEDQLHSQHPYTHIVNALIASDGTGGETRFLVRWRESPATLAGQVSQKLLGLRIQCAQCHDHPYETPIKQRDFWGMAAFFARTEAQRIDGMDMGAGMRLAENSYGDVTMPDTQDVVPTKFLLATSRAGKDEHRRQVFARILIDDNDRNISKAAINWTWAQMMGRGFVNPVDDLSIVGRNPVQHLPIFELLTKDFINYGYDLKRLVRIIANTKTYQLSSKSSENNRFDRQNYSRAWLRPMSPDQYYNSVMSALGINTLSSSGYEYDEEATRRANAMRNYLRQITYLYEDDEQNEDTDFEATIPQTLFLMNGYISNSLPSMYGGRLREILQTEKWRRERIEEIFLAVMSRPPSSRERSKFSAHVRRANNSMASIQDLVWTLLNTTEFFYNY